MDPQLKSYSYRKGVTDLQLTVMVTSIASTFEQNELDRKSFVKWCRLQAVYPHNMQEKALKAVKYGLFYF